MAINFLTEAQLPDNAKLMIGSGGDLEIFHDASDTYLENYTGEFIFTQHLDNGIMRFKSDDGSGGTTTYFFLDGATSETDDLITNFPDNSVLTFGTGRDLKIWHDASHSYIRDAGTGSLIIRATDFQLNNSANDANMITGTDGGAVTLYCNGAVKAATASSGFSVTGKQTISTIDEIGSDTDKFLMSDSGEVKYVTGANLRSYIGAGTGSGTVTGTGSSGRVAFWSDTSVLSSSASLYYDGVNTRLGIGTSSITSSRLDVYSTTADPQGVMKVTQAVASNDPTMIIEHTVAGGNANEDTGLVVKSVGSGAGNQFVLNAYKENGTDYAFKVNGGGDTYSANDAYIEGSVVFSSDDGATCSKVDWLEFVCPDTGTSVNSKIGYLETNFPDSSKVTFGDTAGDLQIYHDGNSVIKSAVKFDFNILELDINDYAGTTNLMDVGPTDVTLYYGGSTKLATSNTGITITGGFSTSASSSCAGLNMTADIAMAGNDITLDSDGNIELDASLSGGQTSGTIIKFGSGSLTAGDVYYAYSSMGTQWGTVNHTSDNTTKLLAVAIGTSATSNGMLLNGILYKSMHGFTVGAPLYLASSNGDFTTTVPTTSNYYARVLGYAIDSNHIYFCPDNTWVKID